MASTPTEWMAIDSLPWLSVTTTGLRVTPSVLRMATWGWLMIGNCIIVPYCPALVSVNVPPDKSSGDSLRLRARLARSTMSRAIWRRRLPSARWITGASSPWKSMSTAIARLTLACTISSSSPKLALRCG